MPILTDAITLAGRTAPSRVVFGPHETNLGDRRRMSSRHVAYYRARAEGGCGMVVTETASVHPDDWPYERAPLAAECEPGWAAVAEACRPHGTLVLAGLGHAGGQGSSAYSQSALWAPSPVADAVSREMPMEMGDDEIAGLIAGFTDAARRAVDAGLDGVEIDIGSISLLRQFHSGLTNLRGDAYGTDRLRLTTEVVAAVRQAIGDDCIVSVRLCCDELAPWAGITPEQAAGHLATLAVPAAPGAPGAPAAPANPTALVAATHRVDLVVVVRGGPYSTSAYRPDAHTPPTFNADLCGHMRSATGGHIPVALQGSVIDPGAAQAALDDGIADLVEMTRAQIADPRLVSSVRRGSTGRIRPCILCNQACQVRDSRNPIVSCVGEPRSGYETTEPDPSGIDPAASDVLVVGGGVAGLECARVLAQRGHRVRLVERDPQVGGVARTAAVGMGREQLAGLAGWLEDECRAAGVAIEVGTEVGPTDIDDATGRGAAVVIATGSRPAPFELPVDETVTVVDGLDLLAGGTSRLPSGPVLVHDPVGGPIGVAVAEWLAAEGRTVAIVTPDQIVGTQLSLTGDLADANTRLQRAGVTRELRAILRGAKGARAQLDDVWTGEHREIDCAVIVDCGHRLPEESLYLARPGTPRAGDCIAPRTILEAVLEGRRRAMEVGAGPAEIGR